MKLPRFIRHQLIRFSAHFPYLLGLTALVFVLYGTSLNGFVDGGHDSLACVVRYIEYRDEMAAGYWHPQLFNSVLRGATQAFPVFYPPMGYMVALVAGLFVGNAIWAVNISFFLSALLSGWSGYVMGFVASRSRWGGVLAGVVITTATYRFVNCFVRGALAESWFVVFPPLVIAGILQLMKGRRGWLLISVGVAGSLLSHLVMAMWLGPLLVLGNLPILLSRAGWRGNVQYAVAGVLGVGLALWFLIPQQVLLPGVNASDVNFMWGEWSGVALHRVYFSQLFALSADFWSGGSTFEPPFIDDTFSYHLGLGGILGCVALVMMLLKPLLKGRDKQGGKPLARASFWESFGTWSLLYVMLVCWFFYFAVVLYTDWFYWLPKKMGYLQFPWRLFGLLAVFHGFFLAYAARVFPAFRRNQALMIAACAVMICSVPSFVNKREHRYWIELEKPKEMKELTAAYFEKTLESRLGGTALAEYTAKGFPTRLLVQNWRDFELPPAGFVSGSGTVSAVYKKPGEWSVAVEAQEAGTIFIPTVYYPFWRAVDASGKALTCGSSNGFLTVEVPAGKTEVTFSRFYPGYYKVGWGLSLLSGLVLAGLVIFPVGRRFIRTKTVTNIA